MLLMDLQRAIESQRMPTGEKLRALHALSVLAGCIESGLADGPDAYVQVAILLESSYDVPAVRGLHVHFPALA